MTSKTSEEIKEYNREYYQRNRAHLLDKQREKNRRFAESRRKWITDYKKTLECVRCGENHPATLTFHHRNSSEKSFEIRKRFKTRNRLKASFSRNRKMRSVVCELSR